MKHKFEDIVLAFEFVSGGPEFQAEAILDRETGEIYHRSDEAGIDEFPADIEHDKYIAIPHKNELDLGHRLVFNFIEQYLPGHHDEVVEIFRRKGAYGRYKDLLESLGKLEEWFAFENRATEAALRNWCAGNDIEVE
jgi:hypothetical protein